jgi:hypothetical protein
MWTEENPLYLGAMRICTVTFFLRGNRVGRDQVPYYTVHVTDGWDELADILSSWEPCRCRKRPQWAGAYRVKSFQKWTSWHGQTYQILVDTHTHIYTNYVLTVYLGIIKNFGTKNAEKVCLIFYNLNVLTVLNDLLRCRGLYSHFYIKINNKE